MSTRRTSATSRRGRGRGPSPVRIWATLARALAAGALGLAAGPLHAEEKTPSSARARKIICDRIIDDFSTTPVGGFPRGWAAKKDSEAKPARQAYAVRRMGKRNVLHARYRSRAITIGRGVQRWNLERYPILQWEWRAVALPQGGDEGTYGRNDCAAAVYTFWDIGFPFYVDSLKYSWSSTLRPRTHLSKTFGHHHVLVKQSGASKLGRWHRVRVNVLADHRRTFDEKAPRPPRGIAVLTDGDDTGSRSEAYYANFRLCRYEGVDRQPPNRRKTEPQ